jgi:hypothetical protein
MPAGAPPSLRSWYSGQRRGSKSKRSDSFSRTRLVLARSSGNSRAGSSFTESTACPERCVSGSKAAQRVDHVVEQFDAVGHVRAHREQVEQGAAHGEVARVEHLRHVAVAGGLEPALFAVEVEAAALAQVERVAGDPVRRRQALHQRGHRHHQHAALDRGQAEQRGDALRNDVRVRAEQVVGQRFPVREMQQRQVAGKHAQSFPAPRGVAVARHRQHQPDARAPAPPAERERAGLAGARQ